MDTKGEIAEGKPYNRLQPFPAMGRDSMLLLLTFAAGSMDAISYLALDHVFTAMMTGNTVFLGLALGQGHVLAAVRSLLALAGFAAGVAMGAMIVERRPRQGEWPPAVTGALALEGALLTIFAITWHLTGTARGADALHALIALSGLAMGIQSAAVRHLGVPGIATTYITGTLTSLMVDLVGWLRKIHPLSSSTRPVGVAAVRASPTAQWDQRVTLLGAVFLIYGLGALVGAILQARSSSFVTLSPLVAVAVVVVNATVRFRHQ